MKAGELRTVEELNAIQDQWMALDSLGPKKEIDRVCKLMDECPKVYINISRDRLTGIIIADGMPFSALPWSIEKCKEWLGEYRTANPWKRVRLDVAWCGMDGRWVSL